jgi:hypothetical protein
MADGAQPTLSPSEAISLGRKYFTEMMSGQATKRVLLEGLHLDEQTGNWVVTFGFDSEREIPEPRYSSAPGNALALAMPRNVLAGSMIRTELIREFRSIHLTSSDGSFVRLEHA